MKKLIVTGMISIIALFAVMRVYATQTPYITICHHNPANNVTLSFQNVQSYLGHLGTPHNLQTYDTIGACAIPTPTLPVPTPTDIVPTPTINPCQISLTDNILDRVIDPCITPSPTIEVTPEPTNAPSTGFTEADHNQSLTAPMCADLAPTKVNDVWYTDYHVIGSTAELTLHWGQNSNYGRVNIAYGEEKNHWVYGVPDIENNGQFTIGGLKPHQTYWFQVAYLNGCRPGEYSDPVDP